jgi:hypothetical protein
MTLVPIGTVVKPYGKISAIANLDGERYYFFTNGEDVAMMPAMCIERTP